MQRRPTWRDRIGRHFSARPKCRCEERRAAMSRAQVAKSAGDKDAYAREMEFVKVTLQEDAAALRAWATGA